MPLLPGHWFFTDKPGVARGESDQGIPLILLWDTVLPWSLPPIDGGDWAWADASWIPFDPPPDPPGAFPGFERNLSEGGGTGAPNFPADRKFNCVFIHMGDCTNFEPGTTPQPPGDPAYFRSEEPTKRSRLTS